MKNSFFVQDVMNPVILEVYKRMHCLVCDGDENNVVLKAYNRYCEDEQGGKGYFYDIANDEDVIFLIRCGFNATDFPAIRGYNHRYIKSTDDGFISYSEEDVKSLLFEYIEDIAKEVVAQPFCTEYKAIYIDAITNQMI